MSFDQFLEAVRTVAAENLPVVTGGVVAILVLSYLFVQYQAKRRRTKPELDPSRYTPGAAKLFDEEKVANWVPPDQSYADRRAAVRRDGTPVPVVLSSAGFRKGVNDGFVVDRSTGGLRVLMQTAMMPGSTVQIRAVNAPDTVGFVTVIVRSCRKNGDHFEVGCEFEKTPPWNVLLLFG